MKIASSILLTLMMASAAWCDSILLRETTNPLECSIVSWSKEGLRVQLKEQGTQQVVAWHTISSIESDQVGTGFDAHLARGQMLWRAKIRLQRGDVRLAMPLFEETFMQLKNAKGDDAFLAAEGMLRCTIAHGNIQASVAPWLAAVRHLDHGRSSLFPDFSPIIDPKTFLCPHVPPVWDTHLVERSISTLKLDNKLMNEFVDVILGEAGQNQTLHNGPDFLRNILLLTESDHTQIEDQIETMSRETALQRWQLAWIKYTAAKSLMKQGKESETLALLKLAEVASTYGKEQPWIAGASMVLMVEILQSSGKLKASKNIRNEFIRVFPSHPLIRQINAEMD